MTWGEDDGEHPAERRWGLEENFCLVPLDRPALLASFGAPMGKLFELLDMLGENVWIAGGAIRDIACGKPSKDIDVYFAGGDDFDRVLKHLLGCGSTLVRELPVVTVLDTPFGRMDLVKKYADGPLATIRGFDFICCCAAISASSFAYHRSFVEQAHAGALRFNACPNPGPTVRRALRFLDRGWSMLASDAEVLAGIGRDLSDDWSDPGDNETDLATIDADEESDESAEDLQAKAADELLRRFGLLDPANKS